MITLLRKIRKSLLFKGNFSSYLLYAIGEILLVMIGILLALYVNNKNEERKQVAMSHEIIREIKGNLESNSKQFEVEAGMEAKVVTSIDIVLQNLKEGKVYHDSLDKHLHLCGYWPTSTWKTSGYEALKSQGVELIQSKELREAIIELYEIRYAEISELIRNSEGYSQSTLVPTFSDLLSFSPTVVGQALEDYEAKPIDYKELLQSKKMQGMLSFWRLMRVIGVQFRQEAIQQNQILIQMMEKEIRE